MAFFARPQSASAAVKIVAPSAIPADPTKTSPKKGNLLSVSSLCPHPDLPLQILPNDNVGIFSSTGECDRALLMTVLIDRRVVHVNFKIKAVSILILRYV